MFTIQADSSFVGPLAVTHTFRIWYENIAAMVVNDRKPLSALTPESHIHGGLRIEVAGRLVPHLGYFGADDVCFGQWLEELEHVASAFRVRDGRHTFDEGEQGQPAFVFERKGDVAFFTIATSELSDGQADPNWQKVEFAANDFFTAYDQFLNSFSKELHAAAPAVASRWLSRFIPNGRPHESRSTLLNTTDAERATRFDECRHLPIILRGGSGLRRKSVCANFRVTLEFIGPEPQGLRFRVSFDASPQRWLLPYPEITGLQFIPADGTEACEWLTRYLVAEPRDEFVLNPDDRIGFDLVAPVNASDQDIRWAIQLAPGEYDVHYIFEISPGKARSDYLGRGSRFADMTPPWVGVVESNSVRATV